MVNPYIPGETWEQGLDVRDYAPWVQLQNRKPDGILRLLVAPRRSGKTWFLNGLARALNLTRSLARVIELNKTELLEEEIKPRISHLLIDEPGEYLQRGITTFIEDLLSVAGDRRVLLAVSPAEYKKLKQSEVWRQIGDKSVCWLNALQKSEAEKMVARDTKNPDLKPFFERMTLEWKGHPFLLELLLKCAEENVGASLEELMATAIEIANVPPHNYAQAVFNNGLDDTQRDVVRAVRENREQPNMKDSLTSLTQCRLIERYREHYRICDPVLADWMPVPFRIHHVSDVHVGAKSNKLVDNKVKSSFASKVNEGAGAIFTRDSYLDHLKQRSNHGTGPHMTIVSGDLIERDPLNELPVAKAWVDQLVEIMSHAEHPFIDAATPRVLITGGNHDVNRLKALHLNNPQERHTEFVACFKNFGVPRLDLPPDSPDRKVPYFRLLKAQMDIVLFGSSAFGSEPTDDKNHEFVASELNNLEESLGAEGLEPAKQKKILEQIEWIDPGLVHSKDLQRFSSHQWTMPLRIAVLHHPVSPPPVIEIGAYTSLLNAGAVKQNLFGARFQLVLHGHIHHAAFSSETWHLKNGQRTLHIASAASLGSNAKDEKNGFNEIDVLWEGGECKLRARHFELTGNSWEQSGPDVEWIVVKE